MQTLRVVLYVCQLLVLSLPLRHFYQAAPCSGCAGIASSVFLAEVSYSVSANIILNSARHALEGWDVITAIIKSWVFGTIISGVRRGVHLRRTLYLCHFTILVHTFLAYIDYRTGRIPAIQGDVVES